MEQLAAVSQIILALLQLVLQNFMSANLNIGRAYHLEESSLARANSYCSDVIVELLDDGAFQGLMHDVDLLLFGVDDRSRLN
jgi:hypothetical protein